MKKASLSFIVLISLTIAKSALAAPAICDLQNISIKGQFSSDVVDDYDSKLKKECRYTEKMQLIANDLQKMNRPMVNLNYYTGLRYVDRYSYEKAKKEQIPLAVVFQIKKEDYEKPVAQRSRLVWDNWTAGVQQISRIKQSIFSGKKIDLEYFLSVHKGFYTIGDESGEYGKVYQPGLLKDAYTSEINWTITQSKKNQIEPDIEKTNAFYEKMGLTPEFIPNKSAFKEIHRVEGEYLSPAHPVYIVAHIEKLIEFMNVMFEKAVAKKPLIWKDKVFTPLELALFIQQDIVRIHGFYDGNGRTSRLWQEVVLSLFDMPFISSGNLQADDMTLTLEEYYKQAADSNSQQIHVLESCTSKHNDSFDCQQIN